MPRLEYMLYSRECAIIKESAKLGLVDRRFPVRNSKNGSWPVTGLWNTLREPLKILHGIKLILDD